MNIKVVGIDLVKNLNLNTHIHTHLYSIKTSDYNNSAHITALL